MTIGLAGLEVQARIGVGEQERAKAQTLFVDVELEYRRADDAADDESTIVDYADLAESVAAHAGEGERKLIETLARELAEHVLAFDARVEHVALEVKKPGAVPQAAYTYCRCEARR